MEVKITKFSDLLNLINEYDLSDDQIKLLLANTIGLYLGEVPPKEALTDQLKEYWKRYKDAGERPLFLD